MGMFVHVLEKLVCEVIFHSQITFTSSYLYYLMVSSVTNYEKHSIQFMYDKVS